VTITHAESVDEPLYLRVTNGILSGNWYYVPVGRWSIV